MKNTNIERRIAIKAVGTMAAMGVGLMTGVAHAASGKKKVLAINGSSRKGGNTADMLHLVLNELKKEGHDTELVELGGLAIHACKACFACAGKGNCVWAEDIFQELFKKMKEADAVILGSSTYSADVSSTLKAVIERASVVSDTNPGLFRHKIGAGVAVARRAGAMNVIDTMNHFFLNKEMFVAGSTYWNIAYGRLPGEALKDEEAVANMKNLGQNIAWFLKRT